VQQRDSGVTVGHPLQEDTEINRLTGSNKRENRTAADGAAMGLSSAWLLPVLVLLSGCAAVIPPAARATQGGTSPSDKPAMVMQNCDGTMTVRKDGSDANSKDSAAKNGLIIPAQAIAPTVRASEKQQGIISPF